MRCSLSPELSTVEHVDLLLLKHDSGVESALLYAKAWSKYTKDMLAWVEKRLSLGQSILKAWFFVFSPLLNLSVSFGVSVFDRHGMCQKLCQDGRIRKGSGKSAGDGLLFW